VLSWSFGGLICPLLLSCRIITCDCKRVKQKVIYDICFLFRMYWWKVELTHTDHLTVATSELLFVSFFLRKCVTLFRSDSTYFMPLKSLILSQNNQLFHIILFTYVILCSDQQCCGPGSSVGMVTGYGLGVHGSIPSGGKIFNTCPVWPWGSPRLLYNGYWVLPGCRKWLGHDADPSPPSSAKV
jgi:hypothetical protein